LEALSWPTIDSGKVLGRIHKALEEVVVPLGITKPPFNVGLPAAGTLKADNWRVLFEIHVPLALLSLWGEGSPIAADHVADMAGALETAMFLTCAILDMAKRRPTLQDRTRFRDCYRRHIECLKAHFPGFAIPSHHLVFHIFDYMELYGSVHNFWCYAGERLVGKFQKIPHNHKTGNNVELLSMIEYSSPST